MKRCYMKLNELGLAEMADTEKKELNNLKNEISQFKGELTDDQKREFDDKLIVISKRINN